MRKKGDMIDITSDEDEISRCKRLLSVQGHSIAALRLRVLTDLQWARMSVI